MRLRATPPVAGVVGRIVGVSAIGILGLAAAGMHRVKTLNSENELRRYLLRSVSHDLRAPLTTIKVAANELHEIECGDPVREQLLGYIEDETDRLDRLVANLLSLSRIDGAALVPSRSTVDLAEVVEVSSARVCRSFATVTLDVELSAELPLVPLDFTLVAQLVTNLLENAARHSPAGGTVTLRATASTSELVIEVADQGPGVDPDEAAAVFEPFASGAIAGASGIGLTICKAVVEAHDGTISVSRAPGGGARFVVRLPRGDHPNDSPSLRWQLMGRRTRQRVR